MYVYAYMCVCVCVYVCIMCVCVCVCVCVCMHVCVCSAQCNEELRAERAQGDLLQQEKDATISELQTRLDSMETDYEKILHVSGSNVVMHLTLTKSGSQYLYAIPLSLCTTAFTSGGFYQPVRRT